jgi:hypothetical protein
MLRIATAAGGDWPHRIEQAIIASLKVGDDDSTLFEQLIADIHSIFGEKEAVSSAELVEALVAMENRPWPELGKYRKPLTSNRLARMLRGPGFCVLPTQIRFPRGGGEVQLRGYAKWQFADLFDRYLPSSSLYAHSDCHSVADADGMGISDTSQSVTAGVADRHCVTQSDTVTLAETTCDASQSVTNTDGTGTRDSVTLAGGGTEEGRGEGRLLPGMLEPFRVRQLIDWYRKQAKALRAEMSPATLQSHLKQKLRETLAEELVADLVDDTANRIAKAATKKPAKRRSRR